MTQRPIFILGMHRSGTSCLAGCLEDAGLYLGEVNRAAAFNKKGNNENREVMALNDAVLARHGGAWDRPPSGEIVWNSDELAGMDQLIARYPDDQVWGLKDPRVLLALAGWQSRVQPRFVGTFRHPGEVVGSLLNRAKAWDAVMDEQDAYGLWLAYNQAMLTVYEARAFPVVRYDVAADMYLDTVRQAARALDLPDPDAISFVDATLRHQSVDTPVPETCQLVWERLNEIAL